MVESAPRPVGSRLLFSSAAFASTRAAIAQFRDITADICDITMWRAADEFHATAYGVQLGTALMLDGEVSPIRCDRSARHVARSGLDHLQLTMFPAGGAYFAMGQREILVRPGDICVLDMAQPSRSRILPAGNGGPAQYSALVLPRAALPPQLVAPDLLEVAVVPGDTPYGRLIRDQLSALQRCAASLTEAQGQAAVRAVASLAAGAVGPQAAAQETAREALIAAIKDHIETNLESARLDVESLCLHFGLSRASLYRLFEHEGGFAGYVRERRLFRAMAILRSPQCRHHRIIDLAHECHFSSDTTFIRAFRRLFGVTPGEVRALTDLHQVLGAGRGSNDAFSEFGPGYWSARWPREGGAWLDARSKNGV